MIDFSKEQLEYIYSNIELNTFLEACPGSGKTEVIAAKVVREIEAWKKFPSGIAILTFANSAADELKNRIRKHLPVGASLFPHFVGTFDSFIFKNVINPLSQQLTGYTGENGDFSIRVVDGSSSFFGFKTKYGIAKQGNIYAHQFSLNSHNNNPIFNTGESAKDRALNSHKFENWQIDDLLNSKRKMWKAGFATYSDIEYLTIEALNDNKHEAYIKQLSKKYPFIFIDECQDLSFEQLLIIKRLIDLGVTLHFIGDLHQAIYGFRDVDPKAVKQFTIDNSFLNLQLTRNFRSCQKIINICGKLTGRGSIIGQYTQLEPVCYLVQYKTCPTELTPKFKELTTGFKKVVILSRGYSQLQKFDTSEKNLKPIHKLALAIKIFDKGNILALEQSLQLFSEFIRYYISESIKPNSFNCPQKITSSLAWRRFLFASLDFLAEQNKDLNKSWSTWVSAIKKSINILSAQDFVESEIKSVILPLDEVKLRAPVKQAKENIITSLGGTNKSGEIIRKTIHAVKGETHDVTILISTPDARGSSDSHWSKWLDSPSNEAARFAYVASSRPKHRLIWAVKKLNKDDEKKFKNMGFHIA